MSREESGWSSITLTGWAAQMVLAGAMLSQITPRLVGVGPRVFPITDWPLCPTVTPLMVTSVGPLMSRTLLGILTVCGGSGLAQRDLPLLVLGGATGAECEGVAGLVL